MAVAAVTDREAFQKHVAKVAPLGGVRGKAPCACSADSGEGFANRVGFLRQQLLNDHVHVQCAGDAFDAGGNDSGGFVCQDFCPLVK